MGDRQPRAAAQRPFDSDIDDRPVLERLEPAVQEWWIDRFGAFVPENGGFFTPPQKEAIPLVHERTNALICAPTGSGKTLAAHTAIINELYRRARNQQGLDNSVYCLYVSPMRSLANDVHRNLAVPLREIADRSDHDVELRHAIRHGDTEEAERRRMLERTPHILNTTPETLAILLNAPRFRQKLSTVEYVIVDEIHSLADGKRGTHLAVSLERLQALCETTPTRIGCSATVEGLSEMAEFLVGREDGAPRECEIVDARSVREFDLRLTCPVADPIATPTETVTDRLYAYLHELVQSHTTTLVFTNTRSGAERALYNLRERYGYTEETARCHHGSLSASERQHVEARLKAGDLAVVTTSTSLELGIDMPDIDLVVQIGSPKSVATLLQRVGRAGHRPGETVAGRVIALDRETAVECAAICWKASEGFIDGVSIPENAHDVAAQHVYGMAINHIRTESSVREILTRAYPYRNYTDEQWESLVRYLTADYDGLEDRHVYPKIWRDSNDPPGGDHHHEAFPVGETLIGKRGRRARAIYMTNVGTIPDSFSCSVHTRNDEWVGELDGAYLDTLDAGDVFVLGGSRYAYRYRRGSKVYVDPTEDRPTVPTWYAQRRSLPSELGREILSFQRELLAALDSGGPPAVRRWLRSFELFDESCVRLLSRLFDQQVRYAGSESVSTPTRLSIEVELDRDRYRRYYHVHSRYGRRFNDGLARLLAHRCSQHAIDDVTTAVDDHGFTLSTALNRKVDLVNLIEGIDPGSVREELRAALGGTDLLKRQFRIDATRALMILKRYKGREKSASQQQVTSETLLGFAEELSAFAVTEETYRELLEDKLDVATIEEVLGRIDRGELSVHSHRVDSPTPQAFELATLADGGFTADETVRSFHQRVLDAIETESPSG